MDCFLASAKATGSVSVIDIEVRLWSPVFKLQARLANIMAYAMVELPSSKSLRQFASEHSVSVTSPRVYFMLIAGVGEKYLSESISTLM